MQLKDLIVKNTYGRFTDDKLDIPQYINQIRLDVGLNVGINAGLWLEHTSDRFVIGVEPLQHHWDIVQNYDRENKGYPYPDKRFLQLENNTVEFNYEATCQIGDRFCGIQAAIDQVDGISYRDFHVFAANGARSGGSSLLKHSERHPNAPHLKEIIPVPIISLSYLLDAIPWDRFDYIEHIKTDCEGYDPVVVRSIGDYLSKVVFISSENHMRPWYWNDPFNISEWIDFMASKGFQVLSNSTGDIKFVNTNWLGRIKTDKLDNWMYKN